MPTARGWCLGAGTISIPGAGPELVNWHGGDPGQLQRGQPRTSAALGVEGQRGILTLA